MTASAWIYIASEPGLWTVGFYGLSGEWHTDSDHADREDAARRVHWLNGGGEKRTSKQDDGHACVGGCTSGCEKE